MMAILFITTNILWLTATNHRILFHLRLLLLHTVYQLPLRLLFAILLFIAEFILIALAVNNIDPRMYGTGMSAVPLGLSIGGILSLLVFIKPIPRWLSFDAFTVINWLMMGLVLFIALNPKAHPHAFFAPGQSDFGNYIIVVDSILLRIVATIVFLSLMQLLNTVLKRPLNYREIVMASIPALVAIGVVIVLTLQISNIHIKTY
jgi:hypothetical protein